MSLTARLRSTILSEIMRQVTIRVELRVSEEMNEFLQLEAQSRKLSFEGLMLMYIEERMKKEKIEQRHMGPGRS